MAFVLTWEDGIIQSINGYDKIEDALNYLGIRKVDVMKLKYWENTEGWKLFHPGEIDITQLRN